MQMSGRHVRGITLNLLCLPVTNWQSHVLLTVTGNTLFGTHLTIDYKRYCLDTSVEKDRWIRALAAVCVCWVRYMCMGGCVYAYIYVYVGMCWIWGFLGQVMIDKRWLRPSLSLFSHSSNMYWVPTVCLDVVNTVVKKVFRSLPVWSFHSR